LCESAIIMRFAGFFVVLSVALGWFVHPAWFLFTAFVGANLLQSTVTSFCPLEKVLARCGLFGCSTAPASRPHVN
jgi:hypothetical protein